MKRFIISVTTVSIIWFIFPAIIYALFVEFCGLTVPSEFTLKDLIISIPIAFLHGFAFVLLFLLSKGSKIARNGLLYGFLWWLGFGVVSEVGFWNVLNFPIIMMIVGLIANLALLINGVIVEKLNK